MVSALRSAGGTRQWSRIRRAYLVKLALAGSLPCARCGGPIAYGEEWQLDHLKRRAEGGGDEPSNLGISHPLCNVIYRPPQAVEVGPSRRW